MTFWVVQKVGTNAASLNTRTMLQKAILHSRQNRLHVAADVAAIWAWQGTPRQLVNRSKLMHGIA
jgi:hypothetical protein